MTARHRCALGLRVGACGIGLYNYTWFWCFLWSVCVCVCVCERLRASLESMWEGWIPLLPVHKPPLALSSLCSPPLAADTSIINLGVWRRVRGRHRKHASLPYLTHPSAEIPPPSEQSSALRWTPADRTPTPVCRNHSVPKDHFIRTSPKEHVQLL